jgi:hypothetical protein
MILHMYRHTDYDKDPLPQQDSHTEEGWQRRRFVLRGERFFA